MTSGESQSHGFVAYLQVLVRRKRLIIGITLLACFGSIAVSLLLPTKYSATTMLLPVQQDQGMMSGLMTQLGGLSGLAGDIVGGPAKSEVYTGILKSNDIKDAIIDRFGLMKTYDVAHRQDMYKVLGRVVHIETDKKSGIISISAEDRDPKLAAEIANAYAAELDKLTISLDVSGAAQNRRYIGEKLAKAKSDLGRAEDELKAFKSANQIADVTEQAKATIEGVALLKAQLASQEVQLATFRKSLTGSTPEVRNTEASIANLKSQIARLEGKSGAGVLPAFGRLPSLGEKYVRLMREFKTQEMLVELLTKQYEMTRYSETNTTSNIQIVQSARVPDKKSKPHRLEIVLLSTYTAFFAAIVLAFIRERLDHMNEQQKLQWRRLKEDLLTR